MYYSKIIPDPKLTHCKESEHTFRAYFQNHDEALGHAAVLLGGRRGARLINAVREALDRQGPFTRRLRCQLLELRNLLFLEYAYNDDWSDGPDLALLEPDDPIVSEICLLADGLEQALYDTGVVEMEDTQAA
ncbi:hypothetical protein D1822_03420 [Phaeobacter inhibens]|uniref:hypothetical protein n=1 Tax=Phaeobacter inhibens TaxID=221822 RepID=UPI00016328D2|nr:hypothetical protein [Phaeobacter inhibens]AFO90419.1 hypothetical protein PGA1_c06910 [Phaeobacter inhibens DSM 17395]AUQ45068.1 hypothetical protein PhaeoP10_00704 [Phaeobacter inhibens]AXT21943.1 hypothetical protein D1822_03420 [Phaeobacter inhibens]